MKNTHILNFSLVVLYTAVLAAVAVLCEAAFFWADIAAPAALVDIAGPVAETGFSVTVIAVSILAVITNMSDRRYYGIKAGEFLKFRHRRLEPGFYDVLVIIVLVGTLQFAALAVGAEFATAVLFLQIIALLIVQVRWGVAIAFFYYGKEKEIRRFFSDEMDANLKVLCTQSENSRRADRAAEAVSARIDNLFAHTRNAAATHQATELEQNISLLTHVLGKLLSPDYARVWHNFETRLDSLIAHLLRSEDNREYALSALSHALGIIMDTMDDEEQSRTVAQNCDFDQSRTAAYDMAGYAQTRVLKEMFDAQLFYKLAVVKIYGIRSDTRKVARYAHYTDEFAASAAASPDPEGLRELLEESLAALAPLCFEGGKPTEAALYTSLQIEALAAHGIGLSGLRRLLEAQMTDPADDGKRQSVYMLMRTMQKTLGMPADLPPKDKETEQAVADLQKLLQSKTD